MTEDDAVQAWKVSALEDYGRIEADLLPSIEQKKIILATNKREYIYFMFRQISFQKKIEAMSNGVAQQNLSPIQLKDVLAIVPSENIFDQFSEITRSYFDETVSLNEKNLVSSQTRDLLIPQLVTGKREVK